MAAAEPADAETSARLVAQMEFYFSDANLRRDKFLRNECKKDEEGHWVPLAVLMRFNRLKAICGEEAVVAATLAAAGPSEVFELKDDNSAVRRKGELPGREDTTKRSVYAKGFPRDASLEQLQAFWQPKGDVEMVRMRRDNKKAFKGSVFVEFKTEEEATAVAAATEPLEYEGTALERVCLMREYLDGKNEERKAKRARRAEETGTDAGAEAGAEGEGESKSNNKRSAPAASEPEFEPGQILRATEITGEVSREDFKEKLAVHGIVSFVDFSRGDTDGYVRMASAPAAAGVVEAVKDAEGVITLGEGLSAKLELVTGEAEKAYWVQVEEARVSRKKQAKGNKRQRRGRRD